LKNPSLIGVFKKYFVEYKLNTNISLDSYYRRDFMYIIGLVSQTTNVLMATANLAVSLVG